MKRTIIFLVVVLVINTTNVMAQNQDILALGPKAGFSFNSFRDLKDDDGVSYDNFQTVMAGVFGRLSLGSIYLQPEIYFMVKGADFDANGSSSSQEGKIRLNTLDVPVLFGVYLVQDNSFNLRAMAGPVFNVYTEETENDLRNVRTENYRFNKQTNSLQLGVGFDITRLTFDGRYGIGLNRLNDELGVKTRQLTISVGYKLF